MTATAPPKTSTETASGAGPASKTDVKSLGASLTGQILEWYEWSSYAVFAPFIATAMFNKGDSTSALLATFGVFAVGFLVRPLGGIIFGRVADKRGRKTVLMITIIMMAVASALIGFMPTYEQIGIWASVGLLIIRVLQGFAHGGESAAANSYIPEIAPNAHRGKWGSHPHVRATCSYYPFTC